MKNETEYCYGLQSALEPIGQPVQHGYCRAAFNAINHLRPGERFVGFAGRLRCSNALVLCLLFALNLHAQVNSANLSEGDATTQVISTNGTQAVTITVLQSQPIASGRAGLMRPLDDSIGCASCPDSAVAWWAGEGNGYDSLGAHNGTIQNSVGFMEGEVSQAFSFAANGWVWITNSEGLISSSWCLEAWVKPATNSEVWLVGQNYGRQLKLYPGTSGPKVALAVSTSPYNWQVLQGVELPIGVWSHVAGVCDSASGTLTLYTNGVPSQPAALGLTPWDSGCDWTIGGVDVCGYSGQFFSGGLDEVTIYNTALSAEQIQALYDAGDAGKCTPVVNATRDLLLVYNTSSSQSCDVKDYYLAHRPMVGGANVLPITCSAQYTISPSEFESNIKNPLLDWLDAHPTLRPQYIVLFLDVPSRINTDPTIPWWGVAYNSVSYEIHTMLPGYAPYVTHINMRDNDSSLNSTTSACLAYIDKLQSIGTYWSPGSLIIRPSASGYFPTSQYYFDDTRFGEGSPDPGAADRARLGVQSANSAASVIYMNNPDTGYYAQFNQDTGNGDGWAGMWIKVGANQLTVNKLGRMMAPGNSRTHTVKLVQASDRSDLGAVDISMSTGTGQFQYEILSNPVTLAPNTHYLLLSHETPGGDFWYGWNTRVTTTPEVAVENGIAYGTGQGTAGNGGPYWNQGYAPDQAFGPVDFIYTSAAQPTETAYVTGILNLGTLRNYYGSLEDHITSGEYVAGYLCWGAHSSLENEYAIDGKVHWSGNSGWWIIKTEESINGQPCAGCQGNFYMWFDHRAFRARNPDLTYVGGDYENTPVGAITNTDEPNGGGNDPWAYFQSWEEGANFAICAWNSRGSTSTHFQAVGDPFVCK